MIPEGMRDVLPAEAAALHALEELLRARFAAYGYGEVRTPALEFLETLELADDDMVEGGYRVFDEQGRELMLRTDLTVPCARLAATRFRERPLPLRFSYVASAFRSPSASRAQDGEFAQAGVELIGASGPEADAEVVALLCDVLAATGLPEFTVSLGTVAFHTAMVASLRLSPDQEQAVLDALAARDYPLFESIVGNADVDEASRRALQKALDLGGGGEAVHQARKLAGSAGMEDAIDHLVQVRDIVEDYGFRDLVRIDFGLHPGLSYYTGVIVEAYASGTGLPVAQGGRYDNLLASFEWPVPAVGFAIAIDRLGMAMEDARVVLPQRARPLAVAGGLQEPALMAALRKAGLDALAVPVGEQPPREPALYREGSQWVLRRGGRIARGSLKELRRELGVP